MDETTQQERITFEEFKRQMHGNIVPVIDECIGLEKKGPFHLGKCPFHKGEKKGGFVVLPSGRFQCYGCNTGGDVIRFIQLFDRKSFQESVESLARWFKLPVPDMASVKYGLSAKKRTLEGIIAQAADFFQKALFSDEGRQALDYLVNKRGFTLETLAKWGIGFAPNSWDSILSHMHRFGVSNDDLESAGIVIKSGASGNYYDRFRNRVMFPVSGFKGRYVGFAGRSVDNSEPKYLNTPETPIYVKRNLLYGIHFARRSSLNKKENGVVIVEGYTDAIMAHQFGLSNVISLCGTALTYAGALELRRLFDSAVIALDPDASGERRTQDVARRLLQSGMSVKVVRLPGKDLDEILLEQGAESVCGLIKNATPLYEFELEKVLRGRNIAGLSSDEKMRVVKELAPFLGFSSGMAELSLYLDETAGRLGLSKDTIRHAYDEFRASPIARCSPFSSEQYETDALALMLRTPYSGMLAHSLSEEHFTNPARVALFKYLSKQDSHKAIFDQHADLSPETSLFDHLALKPDEMRDFFRENKIPVDEDNFYALLSTMQTHSAEGVDPDWVCLKLFEARSERKLAGLYQKIMDAKAQNDADGVLSGLAAYQSEYAILRSAFGAPEGRPPQE
jgi:DNA primase catalytic core